LSMPKTSPAKIKVEKITQVAIACYDVRMVAENYWNILGIGPWDFHDWEYPKVHHRTYCGEPFWSREKICMTDVGGVELELMQPLDGPSLYQDFLEEHGEGLHHVQFMVDDLDATVKILTEEYGFTSLQSGSAGPTEKGCRYHYVYIEPLACIWEPVEIRPEARPQPDGRYPETDQESPARLKVDRINQIALVVEDLEKTAENYWNLLGIGPWEIYEWGNPLVFDRKYNGRPAWGRERIAVTDVGGVQLELCQPVMGESVYRDFLDEHGEGLHHVNFFADDVDKAADILVAQGFRSLQSGRHGPPELNEAFNYIDTKPLRTIWEPTHYDEKNIGAEPTIFPR
jgi:catechol 2,3-dioxygenase-like lactoylglutathione lyase family enzyme